jgi:biopolymer transport protein ExbD
VVQADRDLPVQMLVDVMDALGRAGVTRAGVLTRAAPSR